jgi:hypothetical protein
MPRQIKQIVPTPGAGELRYAGFSGQVTYSISGDPAAMTARTPPMRGSFTADPAIAGGAFHAGEGYLKLEGGKACRITVIGYTAGSDTAYFEIRI